MPLPDDFFDLVVGDCSFNAMPGLDDYQAVLKEISRISRPGAPLVCRFFMQADPRLSLEKLPTVTDGLVSSSVRLLLAIASAAEDGSLRFGEVPNLIAAAGYDFEEYLRLLGHEEADLKRTKKVLQSDQRLNYPSRRQILAHFEPFYSRVEFEYPSYDVGAYCPIVRFS